MVNTRIRGSRTFAESLLASLRVEQFLSQGPLQVQGSVVSAHWGLGLLPRVDLQGRRLADDLQREGVPVEQKSFYWVDQGDEKEVGLLMGADDDDWIGEVAFAGRRAVVVGDETSSRIKELCVI